MTDDPRPGAPRPPRAARPAAPGATTGAPAPAPPSRSPAGYENSPRPEGTMLVLNVAVPGDRDQALDYRDLLIGLLAGAGARLLLIEDSTSVLLLAGPATRTMPRPDDLRRAVTALDAALTAAAQAAAGEAANWTHGTEDALSAALRALPGPARRLCDLVTAYLDSQPEPRPELRGGA